MRPGAVATQEEERTEAKYSHLNSAHAFTPVAIETSGVFGAKTMRFVQELGQQLERVTGEVRSTFRDFRWQYNVETQHRCWAQFREFRLFLFLLFLCFLCTFICK